MRFGRNKIEWVEQRLESIGDWDMRFGRNLAAWLATLA